MHVKNNKITGFSLVELSIVLVILGLLTGGILAGRNLMEAAQIRSLTGDVQRYITATYTFRDKYFYLPGDMPNATQFWGKENSTCPTHTGVADPDGTCNGNGDGLINNIGMIGENGFYWNHLAQAGMIAGDYMMDWDNGPFPGTHVPTTSFSEASFVALYIPDANATSTYWFEGKYGNSYRFGKPNTSGSCTSYACFNAYEKLSSEITWNIDTKMDDGKPGTGKVRGFHGAYGTGSTICTNTNDSALSNTAEYDFDSYCLILFTWGQ